MNARSVFMSILLLPFFVSFKVLNAEPAFDPFFNGSYEELRNASSRTGKRFCIFFYESRDRSATKMLDETWQYSPLKALLREDYLVLAVDILRDRDAGWLSDEYNVNFFPSIIVAEPDNEIVQHIRGYQSAQELIGMLADERPSNSHNWESGHSTQIYSFVGPKNNSQPSFSKREENLTFSGRNTERDSRGSGFSSNSENPYTESPFLNVEEVEFEEAPESAFAMEGVSSHRPVIERPSQPLMNRRIKVETKWPTYRAEEVPQMIDYRKYAAARRNQPNYRFSPEATNRGLVNPRNYRYSQTNWGPIYGLEKMSPHFIPVESINSFGLMIGTYTDRNELEKAILYHIHRWNVGIWAYEEKKNGEAPVYKLFLAPFGHYSLAVDLSREIAYSLNQAPTVIELSQFRKQ